jgi:hypothetical protein
LASAALTLHVSPPRPPEGGAWSVSLKRSEFPAAQLARSAQLDSRGERRFTSLRPGPYRLELAAASGRWLLETIEVQPGDHQVEVDARPRRIGGTVRLGETPVEGRVVWGGQFGAVRIPLSLDENGRFEGLIPDRAGGDGAASAWTVFVEGTRPVVNRNVADVRLPGDPGEDIEIVLPGTSLRGTVVDADGKPAALAIVYVSPDQQGSIEQKKIRDENGEFRFEGLAPGRYSVSAAGLSNQTSDEVKVTIEEGGDDADVRLVLRRATDVVVRIRSPEGTAVPGARLQVRPAQAPDSGAPVELSDLRGEVTVHLPAGTAEVLIGAGASGYASRMARFGLTGDRLVPLDLSRQGGTLRLTLESPPAEQSLPVLYHGGMALAFQALTSSALVAGGGPSPDMKSWTLPMMEPGRYTACVVDPGAHAWTGDASLRLGRAEGARCATGLLGAGGELVLRLED